ncbi:MAG: hypothetical protein IKU73_03795 [Clostridia bacterium]|nr:hypothetical protein [Clostridia bacterium]
MKNVILAGLAVVFFPVLTADSSLGFSNNVFAVLVFSGILALLRYAQKLNVSRRINGYAHVLGSIFSVMYAFGSYTAGMSGVPYGSLTMWISIALYAHIFARGICILWMMLGEKEEAFLRSGQLSDASGKCARLCRAADALLQRPLLLWAVLLVCWMPCYISTFPGNFVYDASYEYYQLQDGFIKSYPLLHSAIITRLLLLSEKLTGSVNSGIGAYVIMQQLLTAALFTTILRRFWLDGLHPLVVLGFAVYYALSPVVHMLVTCTTRDVLFISLLTLTVYYFYRLACDPDGFMARAGNMIRLAAVLVFTLLSRNNNSGPLAIMLLMSMCAMIFFVFGWRYIRNSLLFSTSAIILFYTVTAVLTAMCQPLYDAPPSSAMSIVAQPIVRAHALYGDTWSEEDRAEFESYFNMVTLEYVPQNADPAKGNLLVRYANMRPFIAFWIKIGLRHPGCYIDAVLANTRQMWYPGVVVDGYTVRGMLPAYQKSYFYFGKYIEEIGSRMNLLPGIFSIYEWLGLRISFEKIPLVSMFFSIGFQVWLLLHCVIYAACKKCFRLFWPLGIIVVYTLCSACVPLVLLRYFGALFYAFPFIAAFTLCPSLGRKTAEVE